VIPLEYVIFIDSQRADINRFWLYIAAVMA